MDMVIYRIKQFGVMRVCARERGADRSMPKYFVVRVTDGAIMEEFRRGASAVKWARENAGG